MEKFQSVQKTINGTEYKAQFNGIGAIVEAKEDMYISGTFKQSEEKLADYLFENVLVNPRIKLDDFGADKIGQTKTKIINGKEYTAKFGGVRMILKYLDDLYAGGSIVPSAKRANEFIFANVIVEPKNLTLDDFGSMKELDEVTEFAREVMQDKTVYGEYAKVAEFLNEVAEGNFRETTNTKTTKTKSKG